MERREKALLTLGLFGTIAVVEAARQSHPKPPPNLEEKPLILEQSGEAGVRANSGRAELPLVFTST